MEGKETHPKGRTPSYKHYKQTKKIPGRTNQLQRGNFNQLVNSVKYDRVLQRFCHLRIRETRGHASLRTLVTRGGHDYYSIWFNFSAIFQ
jgi:hypothetical protein